MAKITRPVFQINSHYTIIEVDPGDGRGLLRFRHYSPEHVRFAGQCLEDHLKAAVGPCVLSMRRLMAKVELDFLWPNYRPAGRPPYEPRAMLSLILWGIINAVTSLRGLERLARTELCAVYLTGASAPDHSTIGRFIARHLHTLNDELLTRLLTPIVQTLDIAMDDLSGDGTIVQAACSRYNTLTMQSARLSNAHERVRQVLKQRVEARKAKGKDVTKAQVCPTEPEAAIKKLKRGGSAPGYDVCVMATPQRLIASAQLHPNSEVACLDDLLDDAARLGALNTVRYDSACFNAVGLGQSTKRGLNMLVAPTTPTKKSKFGKERFKYEEDSDSYKCPGGQRLVLKSVSKSKEKRPENRTYGGADCASCPLKSCCTDSKNGRTVRRYKSDELKEAMRWVFDSAAAKADYRKRMGMVEPVFGEMQSIQNFRRFRRRGKTKARLELILHCCAHNIRRWFVLAPELQVA